MSHTPGPWHLQMPGVVSYWSANLECIRVSAAPTAFVLGQEVALVPIDQAADAHLIAAAPDLLEALETITGIAGRGDTFLEFPPTIEQWKVIVETARAAIAKAKYYDDPTPWCHQCGARTRDRCKCGPIADNN